VRIFKKLIDSITGDPDKPVQASLPAGQLATRRPQMLEAFGDQEAAGFACTSTLPTREETPSPLLARFSDSPPHDYDSILDETIDGLDSAFDKAFSLAPGHDTSHAELHANEEASIQALFAEIAAAYAVPLKNFMFDLHRQIATRDSIEFCRPVLRSIISAAEKINLPETVRRMEELDRSLALGEAGASLFLEGEVRDQILSDYDSLTEVLPERVAGRPPGKTAAATPIGGRSSDRSSRRGGQAGSLPRRRQRSAPQPSRRT
jgi:hypothetical protein